MLSFPMTAATRVGLNLLALLGFVLALYLGKPICIPLVLAVLLAALVYPTVSWLHRWLHFSWGFACLLVVGSLVVVNVLVTVGFVLAITNVLQGMPDLRTEAGQEDMYRIVRGRVGMMVRLDQEYFPAEPEKSKVFGYIQQTLQNGTYITNTLWSIGYYGNSWLWQWVLVMFMLLFLLAEGRMLSRHIVEIFGPSKAVQAKVAETLSDMANAIRTFLVWRTIVNLFLAMVVGFAYEWLFHLKQAWTWALLTAVACYVPYLGPIFAGIPPVLDSFITSPSPWYAIGLIAFYVAVITLEGYVLVPVVMGRSMELNATTVMLACMFWELVWGLPGLFLAMPLMAALKAICTHVPGWRAWANLMSTADVKIPPEEKKAVPISRSDDTHMLGLAEVQALAARRKAVIEEEQKGP